MKVDVLGVKIDDVGMDEALAIVEKWVWKPGKHYIVTPNPEMVVAAQKDAVFRKILNDADLAIPDGVGLKLSGKIKNTIAGTDFTEELVRVASEKGFTTAFLGGQDEVAKRCAECLKKKYPKLKVVFAEEGGVINKNGNVGVGSSNPNTGWENPAPTIQIPPTDLLFVAFGHPKQEKWIANNLPKIPVHLAMGIGGAFDEISGKVPHLPSWVQSIGLKWLVRLILEPWRFKRQLALLKYLWLLVFKH